MLRNDFHDQFLMLLEEMSRNRELQQQMHKMQKRIIDVQQQALDQLASIQSRAQSILVQTFELHEYPIPRLFIVLPADGSQWDTSNIFQNKFRIYFLCECGEHTKSARPNSKIPHRIHLAKHEGYDIARPAEFFRSYGPYVLSLLQMLKYGVTVAGFSVPALTPSTGKQTDVMKNLSDTATQNMVASVDQSIEYLQFLSSTGQLSPLKEWTEPDQHQGDIFDRVESIDLPLLRSHLEKSNVTTALGKLHRMATNDGHVRWVCLDHFYEAHDATAIKELSEVISINSGSIEEYLGRVDVTLSSNVSAQQLYKVMERTRFIQELKIVMKWDVSVNDLKALRDALHQSNVASLNLTCSPSNATTDILNRNKRSDPLWQIMAISRLRSFTLSEYTGFFSRVSLPSRANDLRTLKITDCIDWKKDGTKVIELLRQSPRLTDLTLGCTCIETTYDAIRGIVPGFIPLEHLTLDGGASNWMRVKFKKRTQVWMDLLISDLSSSFLLGTVGLRNLYLRSGPNTYSELDPIFLENIIARNRALRKLTIQCPASDFQRLFMVVKEAVSMNDPSQLEILNLCSHRNQLHATNLSGEVSVGLELMSTSLSTETLESLLKVYGSRLTKLRMEGDNFDKCLSALERTMQQSGSILNHVEIASSRLDEDQLSDLRLILRRSRSTIEHLSIVIYLPWDGSKAHSDLADFIVEFESLWSEIIVGTPESVAWKEHLRGRGYRVPDKVVTMVPSFVRRIERIESSIGVIPWQYTSKLG
ncbi:hypothetical protein EDD21DRAFT_351655 [Dissophora ornata]|nr:hypothetical protein EDD21DRAFT_351655 [Dissophora ornata]